jgi:hypothetical protein
MGLYMIADQLATKLVPAVRERMQRIRFLTPMTVGALVTEDLQPNDRNPHVLPYLVWEWLVVEAIVRSTEGDSELWGLPGSYVVRKSVDEYGYVDERSYLKTARVFGFHGVYKRLAIHLGLVDTHLRFRAPHGEELVHEWSRDRGLGRFDSDHPLFQKWRKAVESSLRESPVRTRPSPHWKKDDWQELADAFVPHRFRQREKKCFTRLLHATGDDRLGALSQIWNLLEQFDGQDFDERWFHHQLHATAPEYGVVLDAIAAYESFCRSLTDAFDIIRAEGSRQDVKGFEIPSLKNDTDFQSVADSAHRLYLEALQRLAEVDPLAEAKFLGRFERFAEPLPADQFAVAVCEHHEAIQKDKSRDGKRSWFDRMGPDRIYVRQNYRVPRPVITPDAYVHDYRTNPIHRFYRDLQ